jgi:antibiotic biosynthesis monooxygenase (ABM) superfamily enzyme
MELIYPLRSHAPAGTASEGESVTVLVKRVVPSVEEQSFLDILQHLLEDFDRFPGTAGSMVFRREVDDDVEFSILQRFAAEVEHKTWLNSPEFVRWRATVAPATPQHDHVRRYSGMESLFVTAQAPDAPPRWKMTLLLMIAVYPMSLAVSYWLAPALANLSLFAGAFITSVIMVLSMTYLIVPLLTKLFQGWLESTSWI